MPGPSVGVRVGVRVGVGPPPGGVEVLVGVRVGVIGGPLGSELRAASASMRRRLVPLRGSLRLGPVVLRAFPSAPPFV